MREEIEKTRKMVEAIKQSLDQCEKRLAHLESIASGENVITPDWRKLQEMAKP